MSREPYDWREDAACARTDPEIWHPPAGQSPRQAKAICATCPVIEPCLAWGLEHPSEHGVWGGLTERERRAVRREAAV